jgi:hypothetical protein
VIKWLHAYWLVILVSVILAVLINQLAYYWLYARQQTSDERRVREKSLRSLLGELRTHCEGLKAALLNPTVDSDRWQQANDALQARARDADMVAALGAYYDAFTFALAAEARAIVAQRRNPDATSTVENVADVLIGYAPFIKAFGDPTAARNLERMARRSYDYAKTLR